MTNKVFKRIVTICSAMGLLKCLEEGMGKLELYRNAAGKWSWRLKSPNHKIVAVPGEDFASKRNARRSAETVIRLFGSKITITEGDEE